MGKRKRTKYQGVYERESDTKKHLGKADVCYDISYKRIKKIWEKVGWASEGYNAKLASIIRSERIRSIRHSEELPQDKRKIPLFKDAAKQYLEWAEGNKTRNGYDEKNRYKNHLKHFDNKRLDEFSSFHLEKLKKKLFDQKLAPATIKHILVIFREIFNKAVQWWELDLKNPIKSVKLPNPQNNRLRFFTREEANILLDALKSYKQLHDMTLLSLRTGLRFKEITGIKGKDIDFNNDTISILGKNGEIGYVYLTSDIKTMLRGYNIEPGEYLFKNRKKERINAISDTFERVIKKLGFNKGIDDPRQILIFHSLRHTFASWLALQGEQLKTIQEMMRHKTINMTMKYAHLIPDHKKRAAEKMVEEKE